jgi:hypothetical protein
VVSLYIYAWVCVCVCVCVWLSPYTLCVLRAYVCVYACMCASVYVCGCAQVCVCAYLLYMELVTIQRAKVMHSFLTIVLSSLIWIMRVLT